MSDNERFASDEQIAYAQILDWGVKLGFLGLIITGILYVFGLVEPLIAPELLGDVWNKPLDEYLAITGMPHEPWNWLHLLGKSDINVYLPVVLFGLVTIICYLRILPGLLKRREWIFVGIAVAEIIVLGAAAAGVLNVGH